jgi:5-methylcytosine-specific restriction endonuclease McrA
VPYKDREKNYACTRRWAAKNKVYTRKYNATWQKAHPEYMRKANSKYRKTHPEMLKVKDARRRTAKTKAGGAYTYEQWIALCNKYHNQCLCCGKKRNLTADHVVPVSKGGTSNIDNIQPLCGPCNSKKKDKTIDFRKQH